MSRWFLVMALAAAILVFAVGVESTIVLSATLIFGVPISIPVVHVLIANLALFLLLVLVLFHPVGVAEDILTTVAGEPDPSP